MGGLGFLAAFAGWQERRQERGQDELVDLAMLRVETLRAALLTLGMQQLILLGTFFVLPVYLQVVLGLNAFETGIKLVPMSATMLIAALTGPRLAARRSPKRVVQIGLVALSIAGLGLVATVDAELNQIGFSIALAIFGIGVGLLASQLGNVIMSSVAADQTNEAGGLQGTAQNLGASLGTALIGAILLGALATGFVDEIAENPALPAEVRSALTELAEIQGLDVLPVAQVETLALGAGVAPDIAAAVATDYGTAQLEALKIAIGAVAVFAFLGLWFTRRLPGEPLGGPLDSATAT
jgi:Na+/melibiose symporter-like transporter